MGSFGYQLFLSRTIIIIVEQEAIIQVDTELAMHIIGDPTKNYYGDQPVHGLNFMTPCLSGYIQHFLDGINGEPEELRNAGALIAATEAYLLYRVYEKTQGRFVADTSLSCSASADLGHVWLQTADLSRKTTASQNEALESSSEVKSGMSRCPSETVEDQRTHSLQVYEK